MKRIVTLLLFVAVLLPLTAQQKAPAIVAHRGYHQEGGAAKNSIEALKMAWTVNNPDHIKWLIKKGFDYILTDDPVMMRETLKQLGK